MPSMMTIHKTRTTQIIFMIISNSSDSDFDDTETSDLEWKVKNDCTKKQTPRVYSAHQRLMEQKK